ncbi:MAG: hypothetical protein AAF806_26335 [Bacteroidota bacterium]
MNERYDLSSEEAKEQRKIYRKIVISFLQAAEQRNIQGIRRLRCSAA